MERDRATTTVCIVCSSTRATASALRADLVHCDSCGLIYNPSAAEDNAEFGQHYYIDGVYSNYSAEREAIQRSAAARLDVLERMVAGRRLLDVGCAEGYFLDAARKRGWETVGLELSPYASARARSTGLQVIEGSILAPPALPPFDAITLWDTIEHLSDPALALRNARTLLKPSGRMAIATGDCRSLAARLLGRRWRLLSDPTHKFFFDESTLVRLLTKSKLRTLGISRTGKWVGIGMVLHQAGLPGAAALGRTLARRGWNPSVYLNPRDVMTLLAEAA